MTMYSCNIKLKFKKLYSILEIELVIKSKNDEHLICFIYSPSLPLEILDPHL